jgi:hypothetical protein
MNSFFIWFLLNRISAAAVKTDLSSSCSEKNSAPQSLECANDCLTRRFQHGHSDANSSGHDAFNEEAHEPGQQKSGALGRRF